MMNLKQSILSSIKEYNPQNSQKQGYFFLNKITLLCALILLFLSCEIIDSGSRLAENFTITFDTQGGTEITQQTIKSGEKVEKPVTNPVRTNYLFQDWYKDANFTTVFDFDNTLINTNIIVYAKFIKNTSSSNPTFRFAFNTFRGSVIPSQMIKSGEKAKKPVAEPTRTNYTFKGWYKEASFVNIFDFANTPITVNTIVYAKFVDNRTPTFAIIFNTDRGSVVDPQVLEKGKKAQKPDTDPTRTDYTFEGWYKDADFKNVFDFTNTPIIANTVVYAKWVVAVKLPIPPMSPIETIKTTKKVDLFNIDAPLYDRKGNKIKDKGTPLAYSKVFPNTDDITDLYKNETGFSTLFAVNVLNANVIGDYGINVAKDRGTPYFLFMLDNKIYLDDDNYIQLTFDREETYMEDTDGSVWEIPAGTFPALAWGLETATAPSNELSSYAGYRFTNFPPGTTDPDKSIKVRCQITHAGYVAGNEYTFKLTIKQKLVSPDGETQLENKVIRKTFTTAGGGTGAARYKNYNADVFFNPSNTHFTY